MEYLWLVLVYEEMRLHVWWPVYFGEKCLVWDAASTGWLARPGALPRSAFYNGLFLCAALPGLSRIPHWIGRMQLNTPMVDSKLCGEMELYFVLRARLGKNVLSRMLH